jgi:hypothetical protein
MAATIAETEAGARWSAVAWLSALGLAVTLTYRQLAGGTSASRAVGPRRRAAHRMAQNGVR